MFTCFLCSFADSDRESELYETLEEQIGIDARLVQTIPAKEPHLDAVSLKSALKKAQVAGAAHKAATAASDVRIQESSTTILR